MITNRERGQLLIGMRTITMRAVIAPLLLCGFACLAHAQAPAGIDTGSLTRWPPYVNDAETLNRGRIVMSLVGGHSLTGDRLRNSSLYMGFEFGLTNRFLLAVAGSTSVSSGAATKLDDAVVHLRYRIANESPKNPAFAVAATGRNQIPESSASVVDQAKPSADGGGGFKSRGEVRGAVDVQAGLRTGRADAHVAVGGHSQSLSGSGVERQRVACRGGQIS